MDVTGQDLDHLNSEYHYLFFHYYKIPDWYCRGDLGFLI